MAKKETPKSSRAPKTTPKPRVHSELTGFEVSIDQFGELKSNMNIEKINEFLNQNVDDKKLAERDDYEEMKKEKPKKKKKS
ncbi:MAG: hypothetical protein DI538_01235 [Azospira oryzae]|jgi:hypothetical protein|nr:hypothetical protein [Cytophaga sp.]PZR41492.1 MAG: hypothetical protein DI538_01235 [Azospira oryzae]